MVPGYLFLLETGWRMIFFLANFVVLGPTAKLEILGGLDAKCFKS